MASVEDTTMRSYFLSDTRLISCGFKGVVVWSAEGDTSPDKYHTTHDAITSCHFSYDDRLCVMGTQDGNLVLYDTIHCEALEIIHAHANGPCRCVRLSSNNTEVLTSGADGKVILWDLKSKTATRIYSGHFTSVGCCDMALEGNRVVSGDNHGMISIWEKETGHVVQTLPLAHSKAVLSCSISSDGMTVATVGADEKVSIWAVEVGIELVSLGAAIESTPLYCAFSPDGNKLAITETNGNVLVWSTMVGCQWYMIKKAHKGHVTACSWSADCRRLVTSGADSNVAVWDAESGAALYRFDIKSGPLTSVSCSPQGQFMCTGSSSGTLAVVNVHLATRNIPEPSFLYNWLANKPEPQLALAQYSTLSVLYPSICNVQDAQGWSIISHAMCNGDASVAGTVLKTLPDGCARFGLISSVPYIVQTRVKFHSAAENDEEYGTSGGAEEVMTSGKSIAGPGKLGMSSTSKAGSLLRAKSARASTASVGMSRVKSARIQSLARGGSSGRPKSGREGVDEDRGKSITYDDRAGSMASMASIASFSQNVKKVAVSQIVIASSIDQLSDGS